VCEKESVGGQSKMEAREEKREIAFPKVSSLFDSINGYRVVHIFWARGGELTF